MALAFYFWLNFFLSISWTIVFPKFALWDILRMIVQPGKKLDAKRGPDVEVMALQLNGCALSETVSYCSSRTKQHYFRPHFGIRGAYPERRLVS